MSARDYGDDPIKALVRKYDAAVVMKGEPSIFDLRPSRILLRSKPASDPAQDVPVESVSVRHAQQHARRRTDEVGKNPRGFGNV